MEDASFNNKSVEDVRAIMEKESDALQVGNRCLKHTDAFCAVCFEGSLQRP